MKQSDTPRQLEMNFIGTDGNVFKDRLDRADFSVLLEIRVPSADSSLQAVVSKYSELERLASSYEDFPCGLAFIDDHADFPSMNMGEFAAGLCKSGRDRHLLYLNGRDRSEEDIRYELGLFQYEGFTSFAAVSGMTPAALKNTLDHSWLESVRILKINSSLKKPLFAGCVANPFKYTVTDCMMQTFKMTKKIHEGASFAVVQAGWDMVKLLELRWRMFRRGQNIPLIARILFLTPEKAEDICAGKVPGITLSTDLQQAIRKEMAHSMNQFEAAQLRRFQIHAAGAKFLGCSGIQISGIDRTETAELLLNRLRDAMQEFPSFEDWRAAYNDYYSRIDLAPFPWHYYMFENPLAEGVTYENAKLMDDSLPECSFSERMNYRLSSLLLSHAGRMPASDRLFTKKLLVSCKENCSRCTLPENLYVCPGNCPKFMQNGPCGETEPSGNCPNTHTECIHAAKLRRAVTFNEYAALEEKIIE